jgi:TolB-like protein
MAAALIAATPLRAQCPDGSPPPCRAARAAAAAPPNSVAVLYFENQSRDTADSYLAVGLTEAIIAKLGDIPRLTVKSRYLVRRYAAAATQADPAEIGRALGVAYIVTGGVQRAGNRLQVTAEMARATSGDRVWGQQYERGDGDVFAIQEDIARGVATGIAGRLLPGEQASISARPTGNNEAYDHLLRGDVLLAQRTPSSVVRAIGEYESATRADTRLASAWAKIGLAEAIRLDWGWGDGRPLADSVLERGLVAADRSLALDSLSSDAWLAHGYLLTFKNARTWEGAEQGLRRAIALNPRNAEALHQFGDFVRLRLVGDPDSTLRVSLRAQALRAYQTALDAEPGRPVTLAQLASLLPPLSQRALLVDSAVTLDPSNYYFYYIRANTRRLQHDTTESRLNLATAERLAPEGARLIARALRVTGTLANGDTADARAMADTLLRDLGHAGPIDVRIGAILFNVLMQLGDPARALDVLERTPRGAYTWTRARLDRIREDRLADPRMRRLVEENRPPWAPR